MLVLVIALIINFYRRRQAEKFDREIAEAAAEAAVARAPAFLDDENDNYGPAYGGAYPAKYSDVSHGTYSQPPMNEPYGMRETGPAPGDIYDTTIYGGGAAIGAGAAGIGVARARSRRDGAFAAGLQQGSSPYPAFAGPRYNDVYNASRTPPPDLRPTASPEHDSPDAVGFGAGAAGVRRDPSQQTHGTNYSDLSRIRSQGGISSEGHSSQHSQSHRPFNAAGFQPNIQRNISPLQNAGTAFVGGGYGEPSQTSPLPNPFSATSETHEHLDDAASDEEEEPRRVLRVANE